MDLWSELQNLRAQLQAALKTLRTNGIAYAKAEHDYKVALRQEVLRLRDEGVAVGVITLICYGIPSIAKLRLDRDIAKTVWEANQEAINVKKIEIKVIENQMAREWSNTND